VSTETTSPRSWTRRCFRGAVRRATVWCWPGRAKDFSSAMPGPRWPRQYAERSRDRGEKRPEHWAWYFSSPSRLADLQGSTHRTPVSVSRGPGAAGGRAGNHGTGKSSSDDRPGSWVPFMLTHARAHNSRPHCGWTSSIAADRQPSFPQAPLKRGSVGDRRSVVRSWRLGCNGLPAGTGSVHWPWAAVRSAAAAR
jgi:hypothetical protein